MEQANPPQPAPSESAPVEADHAATVIAVVCFIIVCIGLTIYGLNNRSESQCTFINNPATIAIFDEEFGKFIGAGHAISEYNYIESRLGGNSEIGYGPLFNFANFQIIVGKTGLVAAISYGTCQGRTWDVHGGEKEAGDQTIILVFRDCVAPGAWWNRMVAPTIDRSVHFSSGDTLPIVQLWTPLPDDATPDNPTLETAFMSSPWYWNGDSYIELIS